MSHMRFSLGQVLATPGALGLLARLELNPTTFLTRHVTGDWGDLDTEDRQLNDAAVLNGGRIFSAYKVGPEHRIWIITEADRSATTVLLPEEY